MARRLNADDFFTGLLAALRLKNQRTVSIRYDNFDRAVEAAFRKLKQLAEGEDIDIRFRIMLHPIHGDSETIRSSISNAVQRDLISLDNPEFQNIRLKLTEEEAAGILSAMPGGQQHFIELADEFLRHYDLVSV